MPLDRVPGQAFDALVGRANWPVGAFVRSKSEVAFLPLWGHAPPGAKPPLALRLCS